MAFVDSARIYLKAGDGGKGCESFYRDKFMRHPMPDGGNGGNGGDITFIADSHIQTLLDFRFKQHYQGGRGGHASSKNKHGRTGQDCILRVPVGTIILDETTGMLIRDLVKHDQSVLVAKGGKGGVGNMNKKTVQPPGLGEELTVRLELKIIADVGIVGFPNAGKSTLISSISKVKSKIANYPFTTKQPILGIVPGEDYNMVVADLPGLIEGAHEGKGLGYRFLKHTERTKILLHMVDMAGTEGRDPLDDYEKINHELQEYSDKLAGKIRVIAANKMDLPEAEENLKRFKAKYDTEIWSISAADKSGVDNLVDYLRTLICPDNSQEK